MKSKYRLTLVLGSLLLLPIRATFAQGGSIAIEVLAAFDYPGGSATIPEAINDRGDVTGFYLDSRGVTRGFVRFRDGTFSAPIVEPNDTGKLTVARGLNTEQMLCGYFGTAGGGAIHGFFYSLADASFSEFDVADATNTFLYGLNNLGDFVGSFDTRLQSAQAFANLGGSMTTINIPGATMNFALGINNARQIVGEYVDEALIAHGFFQDTDGTLTFPIDPRGSSGTLPFGVNDRGLIVGRFTDEAGLAHGFLLKLPHAFVQFDFPGATFTSINGISNRNMICGRYTDASGIHGFLARFR